MHLPLGALLDWYGPRRILPIFILLTVVGTLPLIFTHIWYYPVIGRALVGMGSSAAILGVFKITRSFFSASHFSRVLSFSVTFGLTGAIYGGGPLHLAREKFGYFAVVCVLIAFGVVLSGLIFLFIPEEKTERQDFSPIAILNNVRSILVTPGVIALCIFAGLMVGPLEGFADVWGGQFLKSIYHLNDTTAASLPSIIFIGMCLGGPLLSFIGEVTQRFLWIICASALTMAIGFIFLMSGQMSVPQLSILFSIIGVCCAYQILAIDQIAKSVSSEHTGIATSLANMIIMTFGYLFHGAIGKLIGVLTPYGLSASQVDASSLFYGLSIIPGALILSSIGLFILIHKDTIKVKNMCLLPRGSRRKE